MISPVQLADAYARNMSIDKMQTDGLSQADSLLQLPFRSNCMNWIVGHLVTNRHSVLQVLNGNPTMEADRVTRYTRESDPITGEQAGVLPLAELLELLEQAQAQITACLAAATLTDLEKQLAFYGRKSMSMAEWLMFFYFHDTYHTGQTEILRQAAGRDDKII
jgi:uncharacterized damage-inducible protein DinB